MVHIRAIPEGGSDRTVATNFSRTFYSRHQNGGTSDRRQPLPSTFAARWIQRGTGAFNTMFSVWREGLTGSNTCAVEANRDIPLRELVRFDEDENAVTSVCDIILSCPPEVSVSLPATSRHSTANTANSPPNPGLDIGGWMYVNLDDGVTQTPVDAAAQSWVVVSMEAHLRYSAGFDAPALGNGCSPASPETAEDGGPPAIAPPPNGNP